MSHVESIQNNYNVLLRCTTINLYVIDSLSAENVLSEDQELDLKTEKNPLKQRMLLFEWLKDVPSDKYESFLKVMRDTEQEHVANLLTGCTDDNYLPLSTERYRRLRETRHKMAKVLRIDTELIAEFRRLKAISYTDDDEIRAETVEYKKASKLLSAIMRRSNYSFSSCQEALRITGQTVAADYLSKGEMSAVHINSNRPDLDESLSLALNDIIKNNNSDDSDIMELLSEMNGYHIHPARAIPGESIVIFIYCETIDNAVKFTQLFNSGQLQYILEKILNRLYLAMEPHNPKRLDASIGLEDDDIVSLEEFTGIEGCVRESPKKRSRDVCTQTDEQSITRKFTAVEKGLSIVIMNNERLKTRPPREQLLRLCEEIAKLCDPHSEESKLAEDHENRIRRHYSQLLSFLNVPDVVTQMFQSGKLTAKEHEHIRQFYSTPIRASEELLNVVIMSSRDVYECFLEALKKTKQDHVYQMLTCDEESASIGDKMVEESSGRKLKTHQELDNITTCCICTEIYTDPKVLPCMHTFCINCLQESGLKTNRGPGEEMPCPLCRRLFQIPLEGFRGLPRNYFIERLIQIINVWSKSASSKALCDLCLEENMEESGEEVQEADVFCIECQMRFCKACSIHHRKSRLTKAHKLIDINECDSGQTTYRGSSVCELHEQEILNVYCADCKTVVCAICFIDDHRRHKGSHVAEFVGDFRKQIEANIQAINECRSRAQTKQREFLEVKKDIQEKVSKLECDVRKRTEELKQLIDKHETSLLQGLRSIRQGKLKEIQTASDDVETYLVHLDAYSSYCQKIMTKGSASDICSAFSNLSSRAMKLQQGCLPLTEREIQSINLCFRKSELEEFRQESCDNLIGKIEDNRDKDLNLADKLKQELSEHEKRMKVLTQEKHRLLGVIVD